MYNYTFSPSYQTPTLYVMNKLIRRGPLNTPIIFIKYKRSHFTKIEYKIDCKYTIDHQQKHKLCQKATLR